MQKIKNFIDTQSPKTIGTITFVCVLIVGLSILGIIANSAFKDDTTTTTTTTTETQTILPETTFPVIEESTTKAPPQNTIEAITEILVKEFDSNYEIISSGKFSGADNGEFDYFDVKGNNQNHYFIINRNDYSSIYSTIGYSDIQKQIEELFTKTFRCENAFMHSYIGITIGNKELVPYGIKTLKELNNINDITCSIYYDFYVFSPNTPNIPARIFEDFFEKVPHLYSLSIYNTISRVELDKLPSNQPIGHQGEILKFNDVIYAVREGNNISIDCYTDTAINSFEKVSTYYDSNSLKVSISKGQNPDMPNNIVSDNTPLQASKNSLKIEVEVLKKLENHEPDITYQNRFGGQTKMKKDNPYKIHLLLNSYAESHNYFYTSYSNEVFRITQSYNCETSIYVDRNVSVGDKFTYYIVFLEEKIIVDESTTQTPPLETTTEQQVTEPSTTETSTTETLISETTKNNTSNHFN